MKCFYPIILRGEEFDNFELSSGIMIRKITLAEREEFFGLKSIEFEYSKVKLPGLIGFMKFVHSEKRGRASYNFIVQRGIFDGSDDILASNYLVEIDKEESSFNSIIRDINLTFKVFTPTSTGAWLGFRGGEKDVQFLLKNPLAGPFTYLEIKKSDIGEIKNIFELVRKNENNKRFKIFSDLYVRALSGGDIDSDLRFILLIVCLESLYLPDGSSELRFKFSLRIAKLLNGRMGNVENLFALAQKAYDLRSNMVHNGNDNGLDDDLFTKVSLITRQSIRIYLEDSNNFTEDNLKKICLI